jgi:hypothetical protein
MLFDICLSLLLVPFVYHVIIVPTLITYVNTSVCVQ